MTLSDDIISFFKNIPFLLSFVLSRSRSLSLSLSRALSLSPARSLSLSLSLSLYLSLSLSLSLYIYLTLPLPLSPPSLSHSLPHSLSLWWRVGCVSKLCFEAGLTRFFYTIISLFFLFCIYLLLSLYISLTLTLSPPGQELITCPNYALRSDWLSFMKLSLSFSISLSRSFFSSLSISRSLSLSRSVSLSPLSHSLSPWWRAGYVSKLCFEAGPSMFCRNYPIRTYWSS